MLCCAAATSVGSTPARNRREEACKVECEPGVECEHKVPCQSESKAHAMGKPMSCKKECSCLIPPRKEGGQRNYEAATLI